MSIFLTTIDPLASLFGLLLLLMGIGLLHSAWRSKQRNWRLLGSGWVCIGAAYWPWIAAAGVDRGAALASLLPGVLALGVIVLRTLFSRHRPQLTKPSRGHDRERSAQPHTTSWPRRAMELAQQLAVVGVLSLLTAVSLGLLAYALLDSSLVNRTLTAALIALVLWPTLMLWSHSRASLCRAALWLMAVSLTNGALIGTLT